MSGKASGPCRFLVVGGLGGPPQSRVSHAAQDAVHRFGRLPMLAGQSVGVGVGRGAEPRMAEELALAQAAGDGQDVEAEQAVLLGRVQDEESHG